MSWNSIIIDAAKMQFAGHWTLQEFENAREFLQAVGFNQLQSYIMSSIDKLNGRVRGAETMTNCMSMLSVRCARLLCGGAECQWRESLRE